MSWRLSFFSAKSFFSTTACVAMPAWSVPGTHSVSKPCMRRWRTQMSWIVLLSACPMCSTPVTFGGGIMTQYVPREPELAGRGWKPPEAFQAA
jgi:hypothetical protein